MEYRNDCRHFLGEKPCRFRRACAGCPHFEPHGTRILILKLGATGDVLRTTPLLRALKRLHPLSHVTWCVDQSARAALARNPLIDCLLTAGDEATNRLLVQEFDWLLSLDKAPRATALATRVAAARRSGFRMTRWGALDVFDAGAEYALRLGISDELKFRRNRRTYQEVLFEIAGLRFNGEEYVFPLAPGAANWAAERAREWGLAGAPVVGLNTGAGAAFAGKAWRPARFAELARRLRRELGARVLLLGGPAETGRNAEIAALASGAALDTGCDHDLAHFAALVDRCDAVVSGDTTGLHLAIALRKQVVALFSSTCPQEIELYGRGEKIVSQIDCAPCYLAHCPIGEACVDRIATAEVFDAVRRRVTAATCAPVS